MMIDATLNNKDPPPLPPKLPRSLRFPAAAAVFFTSIVVVAVVVVASIIDPPYKRRSCSAPFMLAQSRAVVHSPGLERAGDAAVVDNEEGEKRTHTPPPSTSKPLPLPSQPLLPLPLPPLTHPCRH